ncbi:11492_t:CDS:2 [Rhizophagus irregularis]|nr:11492_t:CDS:2 [Rhizophagus irregularis]
MPSLPKGPPRSLYKEFTPSIYFSYQEGRKSFQEGFLGITNNTSIVGFLHLSFPSNDPMYIKQIKLSFSGAEFIQLHDTGPKFLNYGTNSICNITTELWKSDNNDYKEIRNMILPFEIPLPNDIPSSLSVNKDRGKIEYSLRAIISRKPNIKTFQGSTKVIQCAYIVDRYSLPPSIPNPITWKNDKPKKGIGYEISLNDRVFGPRYPIIVRVKLTFFDARVSLEDIVISLKEYTAVTIKSEIKKKRKNVGKKIIKGKQIPISKETQYNECIMDINFTIPDDCLSIFNWSEEIKIKNMMSEEEESCLVAELLHQEEISRYLDSETLQPRYDSSPPSYEPNLPTNQTSTLPSYSLNNNTDSQTSQT